MQDIVKSEQGKSEKERVERKIPVTNILVGITPEIIEMFKGRSKIIAQKLSEGKSKSEILKELQDEEAANGVEQGVKPITHQAIYQVYKRIKGMPGIEIGETALRANRVAKPAGEKKVKTEKPATPTEEFDVEEEGITV